MELGVGTHFGQGKGDPEFSFEWIKSAGMNSFRDEIYWDHVEYQPGKFMPNRNASKSLQAFSDAKDTGINPLLILSYGHTFYDGGSQPYTAKGRSAFARYAGWLAKQLNGKVEYFEIWNEWNGGVGTYPKKVNYGSPLDYVKLADASYSEIKRVNPAAKVIVGALSDDLKGWPWLTEAIKAGLLKRADGVSVHLYNHSMAASEAGASEIIDRVRTLQSLLRASNGGKPMPIYVTETGWPTHIGWTGVSEQVEAEQDARLLLEAQTVEDLAGIWWYELVDGGDNPIEREHRFGLLRTSLKEKPAACRLRSLVPFIKQSILVQDISKDDAHALMFKGKDGRNLLAVWVGSGYTNAVSNIEITGSFASVKAFDKVCGDRVIDGFKGWSAKSCDDQVINVLKDMKADAIQIEAGSYPTLVWVDGNAKLTGIIKQ
jgi:polysaccharide biosynthesis protein PslG